MGEVRINKDAFLVAVMDSASNGVTAAAFVLQKEIGKILNQGKSPPSSPPGSPPFKMTGALARSWSVIPSTPITHTARVRTNLPYALYLERGAVIRPKKGVAIVIPLSPEARRMIDAHGGRVRNAILALKALGHIRRIKTSNGILWAREFKGRGKAGIGARIEPMFLVTDKATIQPRPYIKRSIEAAKEGMQKAFETAFRRSFNAVAAGGVR